MTTRMFWATMLATTCVLPGVLQADGPLPADPSIVAGDITITQPNATQLLLQQAGAYGIVDWGSFSIANGYGVNFQNGAGATLNRVTGNDLSQIMGNLEATGSVYLVNQNGIVFGATGVVNTGGTFVASTLDIGNADFLDGGAAVFAGDADSYVINMGTISSLGGDVAILARNVANSGQISAPNGTVGLVAGREILIRDAAVAEGLFAVRIGGSDTSVSDAGTIRAAAAELRANGGNVYALAGNTGGSIAATGVARVKGRVFLTAGDGGRVQVDKAVRAVEADGAGGQITVNGGQVDVGGRLDASGRVGGQVRINSSIATVFSGEVLAYGSTGPASGGFVEVSGRHLTFGGRVDTGGGTVLIDPENIEITDGSALLGGASVLTTATVLGLLASNNVIIQTSSAQGEAGTILVSNALNYASAFDLTLLAHGDILALASIQNGDDSLTGGGGDVNLIAGWDGSTSILVFDPAVFDGADLATQTIFGNDTGVSYSLNATDSKATGSVYIADGSQFGGVAVGSMLGATRVYANDLILAGSSNPDSTGGFAQLGFNISAGLDDPAMDGDIAVRATGNVKLEGGNRPGSVTQIGHIGLNTTGSGLFATSDAAITIEGLGDLVVQAGTVGTGVGYAMIGNGSRDLFATLQSGGSRSGDITVTVGGQISLQGNGGFQGDAWIGHVSGDTDAISAADIVLTAAAFDTDAAGAVVAGGIGELSVAMISENLAGGNFTAVATDSSVSLFGSTGFITCECDFITSANALVVQASADILLDTDFQFSNRGTGNLALAGANFVNNAGADAFGTMGGDWRIYSTRPELNTGDIGVLAPAFLQYSRVFDPADPFNTVFSPAVGNGLIYSVQPTIVVADATITYGQTVTLPVVTLQVGGIAVNAAAYGFTIGPTFVDTALVAFSSSGFANAGVYAGGLGSFAGILPGSVTTLAGFLYSPGDLTVNQATLTGSIIGTPTRVYDGSTLATLLPGNFQLNGFIGDEGATVTQTVGSYASANAAGTNLVTALLGAGDVTADSGTLLANYVLPGVVTGNGVITQATLAASIIGTPTKVYNGTTAATLTAANFLLSGFVVGEGATVDATVGTYGSANATATGSVTAALAGTDFTAGSGTLLANYVLPTTATGAAAITQASVTGSIIGTPTKVYNGTTAATLTAANFLLSGFAAGEGATVNVTAGTFASQNASGSNLVTVTLGTTDFAADSGTLLSNYLLPATLSGNGAITQATLAGSIIGTPTKVYDGTTLANLLPGNFQLTGFIVGEGATVTETVGNYASANASGTNLVTAVLTAEDFTATGATVLSNYVLPTTVSGNGAIGQGVLVAGSVIGTPTKVYDGTALANLSSANFLLTGFAAGEGATVTATAGSYASANASGTNVVTVLLGIGDFDAAAGTLLSNYVLPTTVTGTGVITQAALAGSIIGAPTKVYNGTTAATLTSANFLLTGFVAGEGATVTATAGSYASANASGTNLVTAVLTAGDFAATGGTVMTNYVLPGTVTGGGAIDRATLSAAIIGLPTKAFDGTFDVVLTAANFNLIGFVAGEGAVVGQTKGSFATATAGGSNLVSAALAASDFTATGDTLLANYILPTTATGPGLIDLAPQAQPAMPAIRGLETFDTTTLGVPSGPAPGLEVINTETTQRILDEINAGSAFCKALINQEYVIDCLSDRLQSVADGLSAVGEYAEVRAALEAAAAQLHALALSNASTELAQQVIAASGRRSSRPLTAIASGAMAAANAQAAAIIETAELVLLRSSSGSAERAVAFTQVAQVVNSTKVLLRSS